MFGTRSPVGSPSSVEHLKEKDNTSANSKDASPVEGKPSEGKASKKESNIAPGPGRHARGKKSVDAHGGKGGDRLSIFGASFSGTLGRKPAPRYSGYVFAPFPSPKFVYVFIMMLQRPRR